MVMVIGDSLSLARGHLGYCVYADEDGLGWLTVVMVMGDSFSLARGHLGHCEVVVAVAYGG